MREHRFNNRQFAEMPVSEFVEWDVRNWSRALSFWDEVLGKYGIDSLEDKRVLEVGARDGGLSLWFALRGALVTSSDLHGPSDLARKRHLKAGVADRIEYRSLDATAIPDKGMFDIIVFKSVLGGIGYDGSLERQLLALEQMHDALKPGGILLFAENLSGSPVHALARRLFVKWGGRWRYPKSEEILKGLAKFARQECRYYGCLAAFGRNERMRDWLARVDFRFAERFTPQGWRYIMAGVAQKDPLLEESL